jgi:hypothetical protein
MVFIHLVPKYQASKLSMILPLSYTVTSWNGNETTIHHEKQVKLPALIAINEIDLDLLKFQFHGPVRVSTIPYSQPLDEHFHETHVILQITRIENAKHLHYNSKLYREDGIVQSFLAVVSLFVLFVQWMRYRKY